MANMHQHPENFVERILALLEERFPWLGSGQEEPVSGADTVDELADLYRSLLRERGKEVSNEGASDS